MLELFTCSNRRHFDSFFNSLSIMTISSYNNTFIENGSFFYLFTTANWHGVGLLSFASTLPLPQVSSSLFTKNRESTLCLEIPTVISFLYHLLTKLVP